MIVVLPSTIQDIFLIPRNIPSNQIAIYVKDEDTRTTYQDPINTSYTISDGGLTVELDSGDFPFIEDGRYSIKVQDNDDDSVIFRGKIFCTSQTTQNYKINE